MRVRPILFLFALVAWLPTANAAASLDRIVAVVNDDVVTETQLRARLAEARLQLASEKIAAPAEAVLQRQVLERLVLEQIQLQLAERAGLRVADTEVERALEGVARRNKLTPAELLQQLKREGYDTESYRAQLRNQLLVDQLVDREVRNRVSVSDAEISRVLDDQEGRAAVNVEYQLSHIFLAVPESASASAIQEAKSRAETILAELRKGADFAQLAAANSQASDALQGGSLGWRKAGQLPELFLAALKTMREGGVSEVLRSPSGFHVIKLHDKRGDATSEPVTQTRARHILIKPSEILSQDEARQKLLQLRTRIENGEDFATLARAHSEDTGSAAGGGDLGWATPGLFVPQFQRAVDALKPGELSQPVQTPFGWHLIQVIERRNQDMSQERLRAQARAQLAARKADERYQQWLRQLRDEAFVEYYLEDVN
jgi:peptidyl-prolyl cis-trans isomerase SurA